MAEETSQEQKTEQTPQSSQAEPASAPATAAEPMPAAGSSPKKASENAPEKAPILYRILGVLCIISGILAGPFMAILFAGFLFIYIEDPQLLAEYNSNLVLILTAVDCVLAIIGAVLHIILGCAMLKNRRRRIAVLSAVLVVVLIADIIVSIMYNGIKSALFLTVAQLIVMVIITVTVDPALVAERKARRIQDDKEDREAAAEGMLGRDLSKKGYIKLNFFNLFWVFVVCCVLGLIIETIWHVIVVDPGVYQDRTGMLYGPFSPIYGFGALLMTVFLNRLYDKNPIWIFLASSVIGGTFEFSVSLFMSAAFGVTAWDYTGAMLFGVITDPIALLTGGRTSVLFACIWGLLGFVWIKFLLPVLLKAINLIPWSLRYSLTTVCAALMLVNGFMTLISLDCWYERVCGEAPETEVEEFFAENYDNDFMQKHFASMEIHPENATRVKS